MAEEGKNSPVPAHAKSVSPEPVDLEGAVEGTSTERLQTVLLEICAKIPAAKELASSFLLVPYEKKGAPEAEDGSKKRKRWEICSNCDEEFDVTDNGDDSCRYHPGELEAGERTEQLDIRDDEDIMDAVDEVPEYFDFSCCGKPGDQEGCKISNHIIARMVRLKLADFDENGEEDASESDEGDDEGEGADGEKEAEAK